MKIEKVIGDYVELLDKIFDGLNNLGIQEGELRGLDHIAYRTQDIQKYDDIKKELIPFFDKYNEKKFGGRLILVGRFKKPLKYRQFIISGFELLAPKEHNKFKNGLEHAEFVLVKSLNNFYESHKNIKFNLDAYDRQENPELIIDFKNYAVKFHEVSLLKVKEV